MQIEFNNKEIENTLHSFYKKGTVELPKRLGGRNYPKPFNVLKIWDLGRNFSINRYKLTCDYINLLEQVKFDEK